MNNLSVMLRVKLSVKVQRWPTCYSCSECHPDSRWRLALSFFKDLLSGISFCDGLINCELLYTTLLPISLYRREKYSLTSISSDSVLIFKRHEGFKPPHHIFNLKSITCWSSESETGEQLLVYRLQRICMKGVNKSESRLVCILSLVCF